MHSDEHVTQKVRTIYSYICYTVTSFIKILESLLLGIEGHRLSPTLDCVAQDTVLNKYGLFAIFKLG